MLRVIIDDARANRLLVFGEPDRVIAARAPDELARAFALMEEARASGLHLAGYASYELGYLLEDRLAPACPADLHLPLLWFGVFASAPTVLSGEQAASFWQRHSRSYAGKLTPAWTEAAYAQRFWRAIDFIRAGDIFQVNLTLQAGFPFLGDPVSLYAALRAHGGGAHGAFVADGERHILSFSPELFIEIDAAGAIRAEPMKGTAPRGATPAEDDALRLALAVSAKDRAENLMIVDLLRNDLGRVGRLGSVTVDAQFAIETLPTVHQMVSKISATLAPGTGIEAILRALFPCGSVTGAPKIRAMEIIRELEQEPRGAYCGSIGYFAPDGAASFNVAIRTVTLEGGGGTLGIGGGITIDSTAQGEWAECLLKARYFERARRPIALFETLLHQEGRFVREALHLRRMEGSARAFGIAFDIDAARRALGKVVKGRPGPLRVRLVLAEDGGFAATAADFEPWDGTPWSFTLSPFRLDSGDVLLRHKTSARELYDREHARITAEASGLDEVVFLNERGELCEGSRTNLFVRLGDRLLTPAQRCGLLDGCLRREMLDCGRAEEAILSVRDLERADGVMLGNSLRGLVLAKQRGSAP